MGKGFVVVGVSVGGGAYITEGGLRREEQECLGNSEFADLKSSNLEDANLDMPDLGTWLECLGLSKVIWTVPVYV